MSKNILIILSMPCPMHDIGPLSGGELELAFAGKEEF